jgi:oxygen-dependent protoporphyrinogen oxidase
VSAKTRVVVVGGGITGLAAAYTLDREGDCEVVLLEAESRLGGKIGTRTVPCNGSELVIEEGADSLFTRKPWALDLADELGLEEELVEPQAKEFSMLIGGKLQRVPGGLVTLTYSEPDAVAEACFLSDEAKQAVLDESLAPMGEGSDESIASFFRRRFGEEFSRLVAEPLLAGTHGGSPETLSMAALYPGYFDLEREFGSLAGGMAVRRMRQATTPEPAGNRRGSFLSFRNGMGSFIEALAGNLGRTQVELNTAVSEIAAIAASSGEALSVAAEDGRRWSAEHVILAAPSFVAAPMLESSAPEAAKLLAEIKHASGAIVTLAYRRDSIPGRLDGTGFLVPYNEDFPVTGGTWSSVKWPGRAPSDTILVRLFLGRHGGLDVENSPEDTIIDTARVAFERLTLPIERPFFQTMKRWMHSLPQYEVGHLERLDGIDAALTPLRGLHLAGTSYRGVGIPDCVRQGREAARSVLRKSKTYHE